MSEFAQKRQFKVLILTQTENINLTVFNYLVNSFLFTKLCVTWGSPFTL